MIKLVVPHFMLTNTKFKSSDYIQIQGNNLKEICENLFKDYNEIAKYIFNEDMTVKRNIILAVDEKLINKANYNSVSFTDGQTLEVLMQLAGG